MTRISSGSSSGFLLIDAIVLISLPDTWDAHPAEMTAAGADLRLASLRDHADRDRALTLGRDKTPHEIDEGVGEERGQGGGLYPVGDLRPSPAVGDPRLLHLPGEDTLRHGARHSAGPGGIAGQDLGREVLLDRAACDASPAPGREDAV